MNLMKHSFASDNNSGIHPNILKAIEEANEGHCFAYGSDPLTVGKLIGDLSFQVSVFKFLLLFWY